MIIGKFDTFFVSYLPILLYIYILFHRVSYY